MEIVRIRAYKYEELSEKAKQQVAYDMDQSPFDYEDEEGEDGEYITKYEYFSEWDMETQKDFCEINDYLFDRYGYLLTDYIRG